jgi:hypothetical protein
METKSKVKILIAALKTKSGKIAAKAAVKSMVKKYVKELNKK